MASSYSPSLKLELIGNGDQSGTWGTTTNNNLGTLLEQAITGVQTITMVNADYTLSSYNGTSDEARNAVLVVGGTNSASRQIIIPLVEKLYVVTNNTSGGYDITIGGATGTTVTIPNGVTAQVYCDGTNTYSSQTGSAGNFTVNGTLIATGLTDTGNMTVGGTLGVTGATSLTTGSISGVVTAPTASAGTNTTQLATTAFVAAATGALGTMSTQNANNVAITGGAINGVTGTNSSMTVGTATNATNATNVTSGGTIASNVTATTQSLGTNNTTVATTAFVLSNGAPTGGLMMWGTGTAPTGWLLCAGTAVSRTTYAALFAVIGTTFGVGDGSTTFNLPNYTNRMPYGTTVGATGGSADAVVVSHTHTATSTDSGHNHTQSFGAGSSSPAGLTAPSGSPISTSSTNTSTGYASITTTINSSGVSGTNANLPPYLGINFIIKT